MRHTSIPILSCNGFSHEVCINSSNNQIYSIFLDYISPKVSITFRISYYRLKNHHTLASIGKYETDKKALKKVVLNSPFSSSEDKHYEYDN